MPKGYVIFTEDIRDEAGMSVYARQAIPTITQAGGQVIAADDPPSLSRGPGTVSGPPFSSLTPWRPRGIGTGHLNIRGSWVSAALPRTAT
jgi:hypothetical protein